MTRINIKVSNAKVTVVRELYEVGIISREKMGFNDYDN